MDGHGMMLPSRQLQNPPGKHLRRERHRGATLRATPQAPWRRRWRSWKRPKAMCGTPRVRRIWKIPLTLGRRNWHTITKLVKNKWYKKIGIYNFFTCIPWFITTLDHIFWSETWWSVSMWKFWIWLDLHKLLGGDWNHGILYVPYIWVNYNDLTTTEPWKSWLVREIIPKIALFQVSEIL